MLKIILVDPNSELCECWQKAFKPHSGVSVVHGRFEELNAFDCMVSPANAFGLMDGGVDLAITRFFGTQLMSRVQDRIIEQWCGQQPVGTSFVIETHHSKHPFLAHSPTMRVPTRIGHTDHVYQAFFATLNAVKLFNQQNKNHIKILACPGLGTGTGFMSPEIAAKQMELAYRHFLSTPQEMDWKYALKRAQDISDCMEI